MSFELNKNLFYIDGYYYGTGKRETKGFPYFVIEKLTDGTMMPFQVDNEHDEDFRNQLPVVCSSNPNLCNFVRIIDFADSL